MDKDVALKRVKSNPKLERVLDFIKDDKNWVYDLFDFVKSRVDHFFKTSYFKNNELEKETLLFIFGNILLTIVDSGEKRFLTYFRPVRRKFIKDSENTSKGFRISGGLVPVTPDKRRLRTKEINLEINKYLHIANIYIQWMKVDESIVRKEYLSLFKDKQKLKNDLTTLLIRIEEIEIRNTLKSKGSSNKISVGRKKKMSDEEFRIKYRHLQPSQKTSFREIGKHLNLAPNTVKDYLKRNSISIT